MHGPIYIKIVFVFVCVRVRACQSLCCVSLTILQCVLGSVAAQYPSALVATLQFKTGLPSDLEIRSPDLPMLPSLLMQQPRNAHPQPALLPHFVHPNASRCR